MAYTVELIRPATKQLGALAHDAVLLRRIADAIELYGVVTTKV